MTERYVPAWFIPRYLPNDERYERRPDGSIRLKAPYRVEKTARSTRRLRRQQRALKDKPGATVPQHPVSRGAMQRWKKRQAEAVRR